MTATYSGNPGAYAKDAVRFLVGDTDSGSFFLQDEEILYLLQIGGSVLYASVLAAETLAAKFSSQADTKVGELARQASKISENFRKTAEMLRRRHARLAQVKVKFGGISRDEDVTLNEDEDLKSAFGRMGQFDHPPGTDFPVSRTFLDFPGGLF